MKMQAKLTATFYSKILDLATGKTALILTDIDNVLLFDTGKRFYSDCKLLSEYDETGETECAELAYRFYRIKWEKIAALFLSEYNPLENYNMQESFSDYTTETGEKESFDDYGTEELTNSAAGTTIKSGKAVTEVTADKTSATITDTTTSTPTTTMYSTTMDDMQTDRKTGKNENSGESVNEVLRADYHENKMSGEKSREKLLIENAAYHDATTDTDFNLTGFTAKKGERTGNVGITSSQQLATAEIKLSDKYLFTKILICDIADFFSTGVYENDC